MQRLIRLWALVLFGLIVAGCRLPAETPTVAVVTASPTASDVVEIVTPMVQASGTPTLNPDVEFVTPEGPTSAELTPTATATPGSARPATPTPTVEVVELRWRMRSADPAEIAIYEAISERIDTDSAEFTLRFESQQVDYIETLKADLSGGEGPDVFWLPGTHLAEFVRGGLVRDLFPLADRTDSFDMADFYVGPMLHLTYDPATGQSGQRLWGVPRDVSTLVIYINNDLLDASGADDPRELAARGRWDWRSFEEVAQAVSDSGDDQFGFGQYGWWGTHGYWIHAAGGSYFNAKQDGCALNSAETVDGLRFEQRLYTDGLAVPLTQAPDSAFLEGRVGMYLSGRWQVPQLRELEPFSWDVVGLPQGPERSANFLTWGAYVVNARTAHQAQAWSLIQALTSAETQLSIADSGLSIPSRLDPAAKERFLAATPPDNAQAFLSGIDSNTIAETPLWAGDWSLWDATVNGALHRVISGSLSPVGFAATICDEADQAFDSQQAESISTK